VRCSKRALTALEICPAAPTVPYVRHRRARTPILPTAGPMPGKAACNLRLFPQISGLLQCAGAGGPRSSGWRFPAANSREEGTDRSPQIFSAREETLRATHLRPHQMSSANTCKGQKRADSTFCKCWQNPDQGASAFAPADTCSGITNESTKDFTSLGKKWLAAKKLGK